MSRRFAYQDSLQDRIAKGMEVMRIALDQEAPYLALAAARETARAALLALGQAPLRVGKRDLALLREAATATSQRFAQRPEEREALVRAALELLDRLFPRLPAQERRQPGVLPATYAARGGERRGPASH